MKPSIKACQALRVSFWIKKWICNPVLAAGPGLINQLLMALYRLALKRPQIFPRMKYNCQDISDAVRLSRAFEPGSWFLNAVNQSCTAQSSIKCLYDVRNRFCLQEHGRDWDNVCEQRGAGFRSFFFNNDLTLVNVRCSLFFSAHVIHLKARRNLQIRVPYLWNVL